MIIMSPSSKCVQLALAFVSWRTQLVTWFQLRIALSLGLERFVMSAGTFLRFVCFIFSFKCQILRCGQHTCVAWITVPSSRAACLRLLYFKPLLGKQRNDDGQPEWNKIFKISICLNFRRRPFRAKRWVRHIRSCCWENMVANLKAKNHMELVYLELFKVKATLEKDTVWVEIVVVVVEEET